MSAAAVPKYADLGKAAKDLLTKNYPLGEAKLELNTAVPSGPAFSTSATRVSKTGSVFGHLEANYAYAPYGLTVKENWSSKNVLRTEVACEDALTKGLKLSLDAAVALQTNETQVKFGAGFKQQRMHATAEIDLFNGPTLNANAVFRHKGFLAGVDTGYNVNLGTVTKSNVSLGYVERDYIIHTVCDGARVALSVYQSVALGVSTAVQAFWNRANNDTGLEIGGSYLVDPTLTVRGKLNTQGHIGMSVTQKLTKDVSITGAALLDVNKMDIDSQRIGFTLNLNS